MFAHWVAANAIAIVSLVGIYQIWMLPRGLCLAVFCVVNSVWFVKCASMVRYALCRIYEPSSRLAYAYAVITIVLDGLILSMYAQSATHVSLITPWQVLPWPILFFVAIAGGYALLACSKLQPAQAWILAMLHTFVGVCLTAFIYQNGFGYDVFVHEASMNYIHQHGRILPKQPFYIGAYAMMLPWVELLKIPVNTVQRWFLPLLSSFLLPTTLYVFRDRFRYVPYWVIWVMLFAPFAFSVPYTIALLLAVISIVFAFLVHSLRFASLVLACASACAHPLVGLPVLAVVTIQAISKRWRMPWVVIAVIVGVSVLAPLALYNVLRAGTILIPTFTSLLDSAYIILRSPAVFSFSHPWWSSLYGVYALWPWALVLIGLIGLRREDHSFRSAVGSIVGLFVAAVLSAALFRYRDIAPQEQYEFSFRLIALLPWIAFPGFILLISSMDIFSTTRKRFWIGGVVCMMLAAWYAAYPAYNPAMPYMAPSVGDGEIHVATWIERTLPQTPHVVLAPQLVSAGALRTVGFGPEIRTMEGAIYPYAIPTGGTLYQYYLEILTGTNLEDTLHRLRIFVDVPKYVVVIPRSWDPYGVLREYFQAKASGHSGVGEYEVFILERETLR